MRLHWIEGMTMLILYECNSDTIFVLPKSLSINCSLWEHKLIVQYVACKSLKFQQNFNDK